MAAVDLFSVENGRPKQFVRVTKDDKNIIADLKESGESNMIAITKHLTYDAVSREYIDYLYFERKNNLKQVLRKYNKGEYDLPVFPRYGVKQFDYYSFANELYDTLCNCCEEGIINVLINVLPKESRVNLLIKTENQERYSVDKYFMKENVKEMNYARKLLTVINESVSKFVSKKLIAKSNNWTIEVECEGEEWQLYKK